METPAIGPIVVAIRGPSRSGKTAMVCALVERLAPAGIRIGYAKRTHHGLDLPEKASGRVWAAGPGAMAIACPDRLQLTFPPGDGAAKTLIRSFPADIDLVLLETHAPEPYPTVRSDLIEAAGGETTVATWSLADLDGAAEHAAAAVLGLLPRDLELDRALRTAREAHGEHACPGVILGTRLARYAARLLGIELPDQEKRLVVRVEIDRCAADAIQAVTGCRPGKRTLRFADYGKLAATFWDLRTGRAVRVAARGDLRERVGAAGEGRQAAQAAAYLVWANEDLFTVSETAETLGEFELPGPPRRRVICGECGEEVADGREVLTAAGPRCRPCAGAG